jgi:patatin-like phospholipase/acyl hydrolase
MFDLICGTSTGGMLAMALGIKQMNMDQCEEIYTKLGKFLLFFMLCYFLVLNANVLSIELLIF